MDNKKKILLGEKDIMSKDNENLFLNINLNSTFSEIRNSTYNNVFDVEKQYKKERNSSRDFRIYGIIDSTITDCNNLPLYVYSFSGSSGLTGFVKAVNSTDLVYDGINVYGKKRGKFLIELTGYTEDSIYITIPSNNFNYKDQVYKQQLVFKDSEGLFVEYGTKTIDIDQNGNVFEINNDFYFMYNKHWIKKDLLIEEEKPATVSLSGFSPVGQISEISSVNLFPVLFEGGFTNETGPEIIANNPSIASSLYPITVYLNKPSAFGLERTDLKLEPSSIVLNSSSTFLPSIQPTDELILTDDKFDVIFLPHVVAFNSGETKKDFYVFSPKDDLQEFVEDIVFGLDNFQNVNTGFTLTHTINVIDSTERNKVKLNFQDIYENRNYFYGQVLKQTAGSTTIYSSAPMPAVLRNGLMFSGTPMEFYPIDKFDLKIKNVGVDTILPINPILGISEEQIFKSGQELTFTNLNQSFENTEKHSITLNFKTKRFTASQGVNYNSTQSGFTINGIPVVNYNKTYKFDYDTIVACLKKEARYSDGFKVGGWDNYGLDVPFDIINENSSALTVTLVAKSPGTRLDIVPYGFSGNIFDVSSTIASATITATTLQNFIYSAQIPIEITLSTNYNNNSEALYKFELSKKGCDTMAFTTSPMPGDLTAITYYLASGLNPVLRNWDDSTNSPVFVHDGVVNTELPYQLFANNYKFGSYNSGEVYVNGLLFLANYYLDNTSNNSAYLPGQYALNASHAINASGNFSHDFLPAPISVIPDTTSYYSVSNVSQVGYLRILKPNFGTSVSPPTNIITHRSFNFRTGDTAPYNTYYTTDYSSYGAWFISGSFGGAFSSSGGTIASTNSTVPNTLKTYLDTGKVAPFISSQGVSAYATAYGPNPAADLAEALSLDSGNNPTAHVDGPASISFIKLQSKTAGVPFYINNTVEMRYIYGLADYTKNSINYYEARPNQIAGVTVNLANNHMGGFSLTHP